MNRVEKIYLVTYRYDLKNVFACLASIRHWYPDIEIVIIKNLNSGDFNIDFLKKYYKIQFMYESNYSYGKFYGSLEPFLSGKNERFVILDTDTALTGKIIDFIETKTEDFVIDYEVQPINKTKNLYWDPALIAVYVKSFSENWFTFNNGIIAGIGNKITIPDFEDFMVWKNNQEPVILNSAVFPTYDQSAINVVMNKKYAKNEITLTREEIMIYPPFYEGDENELLSGIIKKDAGEFRVIHWADQKNKKASAKPLGKIFEFYLSLFFKDFNPVNKFKIKCCLNYLNREFYVKNWIQLRKKKIKEFTSKKLV